MLDAFLAAKAKLDAAGDAPPLAEIMGVAHAATTLRAVLLTALRSGLRNDAPDVALAMRQRFRLAEVRCEEYVFVTMSRFINTLEAQVGRVQAWGRATRRVAVALLQHLQGCLPRQLAFVEQPSKRGNHGCSAMQAVLCS